MLKMASFIGTSVGRTLRAMRVESGKFGTATTNFMRKRGRKLKQSTRPFVTALTVKPPKMAGATLSG